MMPAKSRGSGAGFNGSSVASMRGSLIHPIIQLMHRLRRYKSYRKIPVLAAVILVLISIEARRQAQDPVQETFDPPPEWRPTRASAGEKYVGSQTCAQCHDQVADQPGTPMGRALIPPLESDILRRNPVLDFREGPYLHTIRKRDAGFVYTVSDGRKSIELPILFAFGHGKVGQTYMVRREGQYIESRVSYFGGIRALDLTLGAPRAVPASLESAVGRALESAEVNDCFSCHSTGAVIEGRLDTDRLTPGITCEGCHGPGEKHVSLMRLAKDQRSSSAKAILNPGRFDTEGMTQFCGACHRSWIQVQMMGVRGVENVRFQPYRIFNSKCYDHSDRRISCTACHEPHSELVSSSAAYDARCTACHATAGQLSATVKQAPPCPRSASNCVSCHMPKVEIPGSHFRFTDHQIRVVRPGEPYPN